jgi:cytochrome P450
MLELPEREKNGVGIFECFLQARVALVCLVLSYDCYSLTLWKGTIHHNLHRQRRAAVSPFFSRQSVLNLSKEIIAKIDRLCERLQEFRKSGTVVNIEDAYTALTVDIITEYCFAKPNGSLDSPDLGHEWRQTLTDITLLCHLNSHFPFLNTLMQKFPLFLVKRLSPHFMSFVGHIKVSIPHKNNQWINKALGYRHPTGRYSF